MAIRITQDKIETSEPKVLQITIKIKWVNQNYKPEISKAVQTKCLLGNHHHNCSTVKMTKHLIQRANKQFAQTKTIKHYPCPFQTWATVLMLLKIIKGVT